MALMQRGNKWVWFVLSIFLVATPIYSKISNLEVAFQWTQLEFDYASPSERQRDVSSGIFRPGTISATDMDVFYTSNNNPDRVFVSIPRFVTGVPATLGIVTNKTLNGNPIIKPYPNWSWHRHPEKCKKDRIVSNFRMKIDKCERLWVVDNGIIGEQQICPPQIMAFDLKTNQLLYRHEFSPKVQNPSNMLTTPIVDIRDSECNNSFVYMADPQGFTLVVYDVAQDKSWKIKDKTFYPFPTYGTVTIAGESFESMDGIVGLALSPYVPGEDRVLFYHVLSSVLENWVLTSDIRNYSLFENNPSGAPQIFHTLPGKRSSQSAADDIDKNGIMIFGQIQECQIACWNTKTKYGRKNIDIIASNQVTLQFPSGIKIIENKKGEQELWVISSRLQKGYSGTLDPKEINFRILVGKLDELLDGTKCKAKDQH